MDKLQHQKYLMEALLTEEYILFNFFYKLLVQQIGERLCVFDTSMKFGTQVDFAFVMTFSYTAISNFSQKKIATVFTLSSG